MAKIFFVDNLIDFCFEKILSKLTAVFTRQQQKFHLFFCVCPSSDCHQPPTCVRVILYRLERVENNRIFLSPTQASFLASLSENVEKKRSAHQIIYKRKKFIFLVWTSARARFKKWLIYWQDGDKNRVGWIYFHFFFFFFLIAVGLNVIIIRLAESMMLVKPI